ncbi:MAG: hypothetical protein EHM54_10470 [Nitrospiraceae bacterium]|nr:MAG: hypothetical protein EHM54_10470 [Nitrospiraceae bacterium]
MKIPIVREWGSWAVFFTSCLGGLIAGLRMRPWVHGREFAAETLLTILGLTLLINSKPSIASSIRSKGKKEHILWLLFFVIAGLALLTPFLVKGLNAFLIFALPAAGYLILLWAGKEHNLATELTGFSLLTVAAPAVYFAVTGDMSWKLYLAVTLFFWAGVLKVRMRLRKSGFFRSVMIFYCVTVSLIYNFLGVPVLILLPLLENVFTALWLRPEKLRATGYTELAKGILFLIFIWLFWN